MVLTKKEVQELVSYYYANKKLAHIKLKPVGHVDGYFVSELIDDALYNVNTVDDKPEEVFLVKIYDIKPYEERIE